MLLKTSLADKTKNRNLSPFSHFNFVYAVKYTSRLGDFSSLKSFLVLPMFPRGVSANLNVNNDARRCLYKCRNQNLFLSEENPQAGAAFNLTRGSLIIIYGRGSRNAALVRLMLRE